MEKCSDLATLSLETNSKKLFVKAQMVKNEVFLREDQWK